MLYIVYVQEMDNDEVHWVVELNNVEVSTLHRRFEKIEKVYAEGLDYFSWSIVELVDQGTAELDEFLGDIQDNIEEEDAPAIHAGD